MMFQHLHQYQISSIVLQSKYLDLFCDHNSVQIYFSYTTKKTIKMNFSVGL